MANNIMSLDCESNGLHGQIFAVAVSMQTRDRGEIGTWTARCPVIGQIDPWVAENVLPGLDGPDGIRENGIRESGTDMLLEWRHLYDQACARRDIARVPLDIAREWVSRLMGEMK